MKSIEDDFNGVIIKHINTRKDLKSICKSENISYEDLLKHISKLRESGDILYDDYIESKRLNLKVRKSLLMPLIEKCLNGERVTKKMISETTGKKRSNLTDLLKDVTPKTQEEIRLFNSVIQEDKTLRKKKEIIQDLLNEDKDLGYKQISETLNITRFECNKITKRNQISVNRNKTERDYDDNEKILIKSIFNLAIDSKISFDNARRRLGICFNGCTSVMEDKVFLEIFSKEIEELNNILEFKNFTKEKYDIAKEEYLKSKLGLVDIGIYLGYANGNYFKGKYLEYLNNDTEENKERHKEVMRIKENSRYRQIRSIIKNIIKSKCPYEFLIPLQERNLSNSMISAISLLDIYKFDKELIDNLIDTLIEYPEIKSEFLKRLKINELIKEYYSDKVIIKERKIVNV